MSILNKILEEIEERLNMVENIPINEDDDFLDCEECYETGSVQGRFEELLWCRNIIRSHMGEVAEDWISVEERLPEEKGDITKDFNLFKESLYLITDGTSVTIAPFDGGYFRCCDDYAPYTDAIAWKPLPEPYKSKKDITASGKEHIMSRFMKVE